MGVYVPLGEETFEMSNSTVVHMFGIPLEVLVKYVQQEIEQISSLKSLPFALFFVIVFSMCFINHDHAVLIGDVEHAINVNLHENAVFAYTDPGWMAHKDLNDVHGVADV